MVLDSTKRQMPGAKARANGHSFRGLKPPAPSGIGDLQPWYKQAAEKGLHTFEAAEKRSSGAKALMILRHLWHATQRVPRPCPDTEPSHVDPQGSFSAVCKALLIWRHFRRGYELIRKLRIGSAVCNSAVLTACRLPATPHVGQEAHMTADREVGATYLALKQSMFAKQVLGFRL